VFLFQAVIFFIFKLHILNCSYSIFKLLNFSYLNCILNYRYSYFKL
uniref:Uncharacterized protein n=1 Tax=Ciona intestinalis TaxID=7719 RepID=H2Y2T8_CIOIN